MYSGGYLKLGCFSVLSVYEPEGDHKFMNSSYPKQCGKLKVVQLDQLTG